MTNNKTSSSKAPRSQFVERLWELLNNPQDPDSLRWINDSAFEITCDEVKARAALSPKWDFKSLSSFIRQLSYYNFNRRLTDRRRSGDRKGSITGYVVFTHPSGHFMQSDRSRLHLITRKARHRPESRDSVSASSTRNASMSNRLSLGDISRASGSSQAFVPPTFEPQYGEDRRALLPTLLASTMQSPTTASRPLSFALPNTNLSQSNEPIRGLFSSSYTPTVDGGRSSAASSKGIQRWSAYEPPNRGDKALAAAANLSSQRNEGGYRFNSTGLLSPRGSGPEESEELRKKYQPLQQNDSSYLSRSKPPAQLHFNEYPPAVIPYPTPTTTYPAFNSRSLSASGPSPGSFPTNGAYFDLNPRSTTHTMATGLPMPYESPNNIAQYQESNIKESEVLPSKSIENDHVPFSTHVQYGSNMAYSQQPPSQQYYQSPQHHQQQKLHHFHAEAPTSRRSSSSPFNLTSSTDRLLGLPPAHSDATAPNYPNQQYYSNSIGVQPSISSHSTEVIPDAHYNDVEGRRYSYVLEHSPGSTSGESSALGTPFLATRDLVPVSEGSAPMGTPMVMAPRANTGNGMSGANWSSSDGPEYYDSSSYGFSARN